MSTPRDGGSDRDETPKGPAMKGPQAAPNSMRASIMAVFFCGLCFGLVGFAVFGWRTGAGVTLGGSIATANLWVFAKVGEAFMARKGRTAPWGVIAVLKMVFLFGGVWLVLRTGAVSALALVAGYAALPIGITLGSLFGPRPAEDDDNQTPPPRGTGM
jgi:hypothetical protein